MSAAPQYPVRATYAPEAFEVANEPAARRMILMPEYGHTTEQRWATETPYLAELLGQWLAPGPDTLILDYGTGIGRLSKALIERHGCQAIGVDISRSMRALALMHVNSDRFTAVSPSALDALVERGLRCDAAISVWVLQHCFAPEKDIALLRRAVKPGGGMAVVNTRIRSVPTREHGFGDDGIDILALLGRHFTIERAGKPRADILAPQLAEGSFLALLRNDPPAVAGGGQGR